MEPVPSPLNVYKYGYQGIGYSQINLLLRYVKDFDAFEPETPRMQFIYDTIRGIDASLEPNPEPILVYRGISIDYYQAASQGGELINRSYTSCTTDINVALGYANDGVLLRFVIPPGIKIHRYRDYEKEILIERGTKLTQLRERKVSDGVLYVDCVLQLLVR